jgi:hypothetical protein
MAWGWMAGVAAAAATGVVEVRAKREAKGSM